MQLNIAEQSSLPGLVFEPLDVALSCASCLVHTSPFVIEISYGWSYEEGLGSKEDFAAAVVHIKLPMVCDNVPHWKEVEVMITLK